MSWILPRTVVPVIRNERHRNTVRLTAYDEKRLIQQTFLTTALPYKNDGARVLFDGFTRECTHLILVFPGGDGGPQNGELCVLKEFKTGSVYEDFFFNNDINAVSKAAELIAAFNQINFGFGAKTIYLNRPTVWESVYPDSTGKKSKKLVEPMLEGEFMKFNSNSGYTNGSDYMQAISHYSYHYSNGHHLLCDLQGGHYKDAYVLTDPVIMSSDNQKRFGELVTFSPITSAITFVR